MSSRPRAKGFRDLVVWQQARLLVRSIYTLTRDFPASEQFGLTSQLRRAAMSVPCNIAEGWGRGSRAQFHHFAAIARGSVQEVDTLVEIASDLGYLGQRETQEIRELILEVARMLTALLHSLRH